MKTNGIETPGMNITVERLVGLYEQQLLRQGLDIEKPDKALYLFFRSLAPKPPEDFSSLDVEEFRRKRRCQGESDKKSAKHLKHVKDFFLFLIDYLEYPLSSNPCRDDFVSTWLELKRQHRQETLLAVGRPDSTLEDSLG